VGKFPRLAFLLAIGIPVIALVMGVSYTAADTVSDQVVVSVTATVPGPPPPEESDTIIILKGRAYPGALVTARQSGSIIATTTAGPDATFEISRIVDPGIYTFTVFAEDDSGVVGNSFSISLSLSEGTTTTVSGIFLGPTIAISDTEVQVGDTVTVFGTTVPNAEVTIFFSSDPFQAAAFADGDGTWEHSEIATSGNGLEIGDHGARAKAEAPDSAISEYSKTVSFSVVAEGGAACNGKSPGDQNCDGSVDLVDFSILLFYWQSTSPANPRADINDDNIVNITDFSIMLYYWTG
jgi:hypothetical protein